MLKIIFTFTTSDGEISFSPWEALKTICGGRIRLVTGKFPLPYKYHSTKMYKLTPTVLLYRNFYVFNVLGLSKKYYGIDGKGCGHTPLSEMRNHGHKLFFHNFFPQFFKEHHLGQWLPFEHVELHFFKMMFCGDDMHFSEAWDVFAHGFR